MKAKVVTFALGALSMFLANNVLFETGLIASAEAKRSTYCEPIVKDNLKDFRSEITLAKNSNNTTIVSSNIAIDATGQYIYYALLCSE